MSDRRVAIDAATHAGDVSGTQTGVSVGSITIDLGAPPDTIREQIKDMWHIVVQDQLDRRERQSETDRHREAMLATQRAQDRWLFLLTLLCGIDTALILILYARLVPLMELWR